MRQIISPFNAAWARVKAAAQTIAGAWTFGANVILNGANNTAPLQTGTPQAATLMTRDQSDTRHSNFSTPLGRVRFYDSHNLSVLPDRIQIRHSGATASRVFIYSQNNLGLAANNVVALDSIGIVPDQSNGYGGYYVVSAGSFTAPNNTSQQPSNPSGPTNGVINWQTAYGAGTTVYWAELAVVNGTFTPVTLTADAGFIARGVFLGGVTLSGPLNTSWGTIWAELVYRFGGTAANHGAGTISMFKMGNVGNNYVTNTILSGSGSGMPAFSALFGSPSNTGARSWGVFAHKNLQAAPSSNVYFIDGCVEFRFTPTGTAVGSFISTWTNP